MELLKLIALTLVAVDLILCKHARVIYQVECDHSTSYCECPTHNADGEHIDVCEFHLLVSVIQTFSRYRINTTLNEVGVQAELWIINQTSGEFMPHPSISQTSCGDIGSNLCTQPLAVDGYTFRDVLAINYQIPGPTIIVNQGQIVSVYFTNGLEAGGVSIHWHGMDQVNTNFMDGIGKVTQCSVSPGASFRYIFEAAQTGTYWYHSHTGPQRTDGVYGALILRENTSLIEMAQAQPNVGEFEDQPGIHTLVFADWQLKSSEALFTLLEGGVRFFSDIFQVPSVDETPYSETLSPDGAGVGPIEYWSGLINGRGRYSDVNYTQTRLSVFNVLPGRRYRFRMVGAQGLYAFRVSIDEHKLKVIALDGTLVNPVEVDFIIIHSGERYDFLLELLVVITLQLEVKHWRWSHTLQMPSYIMVETIMSLNQLSMSKYLHLL